MLRDLPGATLYNLRFSLTLNGYFVGENKVAIRTLKNQDELNNVTLDKRATAQAVRQRVHDEEIKTYDTAVIGKNFNDARQ